MNHCAPGGARPRIDQIGSDVQKSKNVEMCVLVIEVGFTPEKGGWTPL
jgi:hypothetical protein